jgi:septal ring factor EnvC (AmiA/AmiB activator)
LRGSREGVLEREREGEGEGERERGRRRERERATERREREKERERTSETERKGTRAKERVPTTSHLPEVKGHGDDLLGDEESSPLPWPTCLSERRGKLESPTREKEKRPVYF